MTARLPYGAVTGFLLPVEVRFIAAWYGVRAKALRHSRTTAALIVEARHALFWRLTEERRLTPARVGQLLGWSESAVRQGVEAHQKRIADVTATADGLTLQRRLTA